MAMNDPKARAAAMRTAQFVFWGTVRRPAASNVKEVTASADTAVVRVDEVVLAPPALGDMRGREVTVRTIGEKRATRGARALFLTSSWIYGEQVAVNEVARITRGAAPAALRSEILAEKLRQLDDDLLARLAAADVVIAGRVETIGPLALTERQARRGREREGGSEAELEEDEDVSRWRVARVLVQTVFKGRPGETVAVRFPFPRTRRWFEAPAFCEGQEGIFILRAGKEAETASRSKDKHYTALDPRDYQASGLAARIQVLVASLQAGRQRG
jgi:hypothetical protein